MAIEGGNFAAQIAAYLKENRQERKTPEDLPVGGCVWLMCKEGLARSPMYAAMINILSEKNIAYPYYGGIDILFRELNKVEERLHAIEEHLQKGGKLIIFDTDVELMLYEICDIKGAQQIMTQVIKVMSFTGKQLSQLQDQVRSEILPQLSGIV